MTRSTPILAALLLFSVWTLATYVLEGRIRTLQRPEAGKARLSYAVLANLLIGTVIAGLVIRFMLLAQPGLDTVLFGFAPAARITLSLGAAVLLGTLLFVRQRPRSLSPAMLVNLFCQTLVVSVAEVLVCWAVLGAAVRLSSDGLPVPLPSLLGLTTAAAAFGLYHFAHSPPFNTPRMVLLLSGVGILTGSFFLVSRDVYGTIIFHNFLAVKGVSAALTESGRLESVAKLQTPLLVTAAAATFVLVAVDVILIRSAGL